MFDIGTENEECIFRKIEQKKLTLNSKYSQLLNHSQSIQVIQELGMNGLIFKFYIRRFSDVFR